MAQGSTVTTRALAGSAGTPTTSLPLTSPVTGSRAVGPVGSFTVVGGQPPVLDIKTTLTFYTKRAISR
jgi:hypothetical protein